MVCNRCQKRPAIIFVQRMENGQMKNEGFCLHCARELHIKPVEDLMKQFGMSDEDMDNMENRMESMMDEMGDANPLSLMMNMGRGRRPCPRIQRYLPAGRQGGGRCRKQQKGPEERQKAAPPQIPRHLL